MREEDRLKAQLKRAVEAVFLRAVSLACANGSCELGTLAMVEIYEKLSDSVL